MNRIFKTKWSDAHQQYVVTNETQTGRGKKTKSSIAVAVAAAMFAGVAGAAVMPAGTIHGYSNDPGVIGNQASWETAEYQKNWGLVAQKASAAYALGYHGQGVKIGMMDSGIRVDHKELSGDRWHVVTASGEYSQDGERYPQYAYGSKPKDTGKYHKGDKFEIDGSYNPEYNDNHGTGCAGVMAGNRDGQGMHGVAWGADVYSANTGGTDDTNYGPFPDYGFFKAGYDSLVNAGVKIINNSFGTNLKQVDENGNILDYYHSGPELTTVNDIEYEYFLFKKNYKEGKSFVDAAWDAVKGKDVIQVFTNGNNDRANPYHRALYPYFNPEAESQWIAIAGLKQNNKNTDPDNYQLEAYFNEAGYAKYWTMVGPGQNGYTSNISGEYGSYSGTSMAAPFVTGAFGVLASRYTDMTAVQVREVLLTTANHKNADGSDMQGWNNADGSTPGEGEVSDRMGWGAPDLEKGMYGVGQLFSHFDYNLKSDHLDVWSNNITQQALDQREREDIAWLKSVTKDGTVDGEIVVSDNPDDYKLTNTSTGEANRDGQDHNYDLAGIDKNITFEDAKKWRLEYYQKRAAEIRNKIANNLYDGALTKRGTGTLVMTGNNIYRGGTTVEEGTLLGFNDSFGVTGDDASATANGKVTVNGGTFGILTSYNDQLTQKGEIKDTATDHSVDVTVNANGKLMIMAGQNAEMGDLKLAEGATIVVGSLDDATLKQAYNGKAAEGTLKVQSMDGEVKVASDLAFFESTVTPVAVQASSGPTTLNVTLERNDKVNFATFAQNANGSSIANAIEAQGNGTLFDTLLGSSASDVTATYNSLGNDVYLNAQNAGVVNGLTMVRVIKDEANGIGEGRSAEMANGTARLWATGVGSWGNFDYGMSDMDSDFYAGLLGAEIDVAQNTKVGLFFGAGQTDNKAGVNGKVKTDDLHFGVYGMTNIGEVTTVNFGIARTHQDAEGSRLLQVGSQVGLNGYKGDTDITQFYIEGNCKAMNTAAYQFEPYVGFNWIHVEADGFNEQVGNVSIASTLEDRDMQVTTLGVRAGAPFTIGQIGMTVKGDLAWSHFFGDNAATSAMNLDGVATKIEGGELEDVASVGLGVEAQLTKSTTFGLNYTGTYDSDIAAHGVFANVRMNF